MNDLTSIKTPFNSISNLLKWGRLATRIGSAQMLIQIIGLASGILIIRVLPTHEYALYTLANTMLGTMVILSDGGISTGVMAIGGKYWEDRIKLGSVINTGLNLRKQFAVISLIIAVPILVYLLRMHEASWLMTGLIIAALIPAYLASLSDSLLEVAPKLVQDIGPLQRNQINASLGRGLLLCSVILFPFTFIAVFAASIPRIIANRQLRKISFKHADLAQPVNAEHKKGIITIVKRMLPTAVYYSLSGQISIWVVSLVGSTVAIANLGALGRVTIMLNFITIIFGILFTPRFARLPTERIILLSYYIKIQCLMFFVGFLIVTFVYFFPSETLWILGESYFQLEKELLLAILGAVLALIAGSSFTLYTSRGWVINPLISIPINLFTIVLSALLLNLSTLEGALTLTIILEAQLIIMNMVYILIKISATKKTDNIPNT